MPQTPENREPRPTAAAAPQPSVRSPSAIGPSITIKGNVIGGEDLLIEGQIEGQVTVEEHNVTVGRRGRLKADIRGKSIRVEGEVQGDLLGTEEVVIRQTGRVEGNLKAPRVTLENGARFRGSIDMEGGRDSEAPAKSETRSSSGQGGQGGQGSSAPKGSPAGGEVPRAAKSS